MSEGVVIPWKVFWSLFKTSNFEQFTANIQMKGCLWIVLDLPCLKVSSTWDSVMYIVTMRDEY